jgi:uncharacterized damage-inducible protein DinB
MYTPEAMRDMHERTHRSLHRLIEHCEQFSAESLDQEMPGFGYPSIRLQIHHVIGAEEYWVGVLNGEMRVEDSAGDYPTIATLKRYRERVARTTMAYLLNADSGELNTPREMVTWPNKKRELVPAHILLRFLTHIYQHQGQVLAICRLLGKPGPGGFDFPLEQ